MNEQKYIVTVTQEEVIQLEVMATSEAEARRTFIEYGGRRIKSWRECDRISSVVKADDPAKAGFCGILAQTHHNR